MLNLCLDLFKYVFEHFHHLFFGFFSFLGIPFRPLQDRDKFLVEAGLHIRVGALTLSYLLLHGLVQRREVCVDAVFYNSN